MVSCFFPFFASSSSSSTSRRGGPASAAPAASSASVEKSCCSNSDHPHAHNHTLCAMSWLDPPAYSDLQPLVRRSSSTEKGSGLPPAAELETLEGEIEKLDKELRKLSMAIHEVKEIAWQEVKTHDLLAEFTESHGFTVTRHCYGLKTAFEATFEHGKGGPVIGFNSEEDALPGIGHACGHNLIAIAGVGAALAVAAALKKHDQPGKVILLGTPAEELDGGKINLIKAGAYKPMDVCLMLHPAPFEGLGEMLAVSGLEVEFEGHNSHAAGAPWEGINAQDAVVLAYNNVSALRQQLHPTYRVHGVIKGSENWVQNIIPGQSAAFFGARCPNDADLQILKVKVENCFKAAAIATGCKLKKLEWAMNYKDLRNNESLGEEYAAYMKERQGVDMLKIPALGSTDFGDVSYELPSLHPIFAIPVGPGEGNHTPGFAACAATKQAHSNTLRASKGIAVAGWKCVVDKAFLDQVKDDFAKMQK